MATATATYYGQEPYCIGDLEYDIDPYMEVLLPKDTIVYYTGARMPQAPHFQCIYTAGGCGERAWMQRALRS